MKPIRIAAVADIGNWCFANRANGLRKHAPRDIVIEPIFACSQSLQTICWPKFDIIFLLNTMILDRVRATMDIAGCTAPLVVSHNSGLGRRFEMLRDATIAADYVIINNYQSYLNARAGARKNLNVCNISNGLDLDTFKVTTPIEDRSHRVLWCGSHTKAFLESRDSGEHDVKRYRAVLQPMQMLLNNVKDQDWETDFVVVGKNNPGLSSSAMCDWYNTGSYLLCPSKSEGTPNIALEAAACGCIPVTGPIGNMAECFADGESFSLARGSQIPDFYDALKRARENREEMSRNAVEAISTWGWENRSKWFFALFRALAEGFTPPPFSYMDGEPQDVLPDFADAPDAVLAHSLNGHSRLGV